MNKIAILVLLGLPGCYSAHAPAQGAEADACAVEWVCTGALADDGVCEGLMVAIDPCHAAPEPPVCEGTYARGEGGGYVFAPDGEDCRPAI